MHQIQTLQDSKATPWSTMEFLLLCSLLSISCVLLLILVELKKFMKHMERVVELLTVINDTVTCRKPYSTS